MNQRLQDIYDFFKPMPETCTWSNGRDSVNVHWQGAEGRIRWYVGKGGQVGQEWVEEKDELG